MQQYQQRHAGYSLPPTVKDLPGRGKDERNARLMRLLADLAPVAGGGIGALVGSFGGPGGTAAGMGIGSTLGQLGATGLESGANETMMPHTERDMQRTSRRDRLMSLLGKM